MIVKKILLSILTFTYLMLSTGIAMEIHYCMGKKAGIDFYKLENEKCGRCGMLEKKNGCCNDEHKFYKIEDSFKHSSNNINFSFFEGRIITAYFVFSHEPILLQSIIKIPPYYSPPFETYPSECIKNCVFRI